MDQLKPILVIYMGGTPGNAQIARTREEVSHIEWMRDYNIMLLSVVDESRVELLSVNNAEQLDQEKLNELLSLCN